MKKTFNEAKIELIFVNADVITASLANTEGQGGTTSGDGPGGF